MKNWQFILILVWYLLVANTTFIYRGFSYIGYSLLIATVFGLMSFNIRPKNLFQRTVYHVIFMASLFYVFTEIAYKFNWASDLLDPTKYNYVYFLSFIYLLISILVLRCHNQIK